MSTLKKGNLLARHCHLSLQCWSVNRLGDSCKHCLAGGVGNYVGYGDDGDDGDGGDGGEDDDGVDHCEGGDDGDGATSGVAAPSCRASPPLRRICLGSTRHCH